MPRNNPQHRRGKGNPKPKPRKHSLPKSELSHTDIAAMINMGTDEVVYSTAVGHIPVVGLVSEPGHRSVPEPGHRVWAQYPARP